MVYLTETRQGRAIAVQHRPDSSWKARQSSVAAGGLPSLSLRVFCQDVRLMHGARAGMAAGCLGHLWKGVRQRWTPSEGYSP